jgi:hypothetical protein
VKTWAGLLKTATQATQAHVKQRNASWPVTFALQHPSAAAKHQNYSKAWRQSSPNYLTPLQVIACTALHSVMHRVASANFKRTSSYYQCR